LPYQTRAPLHFVMHSTHAGEREDLRDVDAPYTY